MWLILVFLTDKNRPFIMLWQILVADHAKWMFEYPLFTKSQTVITVIRFRMSLGYYFASRKLARTCTACVTLATADYKHNRRQTRLTQRGRVTHIRVSKLTIIGSDDGLSHGRRQAIIWTNAGICILFTKMYLNMSSGKWQSFCLGLNVSTQRGQMTHICVSKLDQHWFREWLLP